MQSKMKYLDHCGNITKPHVIQMRNRHSSIKSYKRKENPKTPTSKRIEKRKTHQVNRNGDGKTLKIESTHESPRGEEAEK